MTEPPPHPRTPEQLEAVRRRSTTVAICAAFTGFAGIALLLTKSIDAEHPPAVIGAFLASFALPMGIGILFYVKGAPQVRLAIVASILAIAAGLAGPLVYARQSILWHSYIENREFQNVQIIAQASLQFARAHDGNYPPDLLTLLRANQISLQEIRSPFGTTQTPQQIQLMDFQLKLLRQLDGAESQNPGPLASLQSLLTAQLANEIDILADYQYFGAGLKLPPAKPNAPKPNLPEEIILITSRNAIMGEQISVGFVTGHAQFLHQTAAETALRQSNDARATEGFPPIRPPEVLHRAQTLEPKNQPNR